jgi:hypothetical protein
MINLDDKFIDEDDKFLSTIDVDDDFDHHGYRWWFSSTMDVNDNFGWLFFSTIDINDNFEW